MGIKGLCQYLRKLDPNISVEVPLTCFSGSRVAVDVSVYMYKFICIDNKLQGNWVDLFINLITWLRLNNIRPVFIFDGTPPPQKQRTQKNRRSIRAESEAKVVEADTLLELVNEIPENEDLPPHLVERVDTLLRPTGRMAGKTEFKSSSQLSRKEVLCNINTEYKKYNSRCIKVRPQDLETVRKLVDSMGLPWYNAVGEAERTCAWLCRWGYVKAVLSTDSDVLAYQAPMYINELRVNEPTCKIIRYSDALEVLDMNDQQFLDFCIMCGTDYNDRMPGIGPAKAYRLLDEYGDLDNLLQHLPEAEILYHTESRELFNLPDGDNPQTIIEGIEEGQLFKISPIKSPDTGKLLMILMKNVCYYNTDQVLNTKFKPLFKII